LTVSIKQDISSITTVSMKRMDEMVTKF